MVTHSVTFLSQCDLIIVLKDGSVSESGTFKELTDKKGDFADFLLTYLKENAVEPDEEGNFRNAFLPLFFFFFLFNFEI